MFASRIAEARTFAAIADSLLSAGQTICDLLDLASESGFCVLAMPLPPGIAGVPFFRGLLCPLNMFGAI